jgi:hypothetical protein
MARTDITIRLTEDQYREMTERIDSKVRDRIGIMANFLLSLNLPPWEMNRLFVALGDIPADARTSPYDFIHGMRAEEV